jgi:hypothetical protein
MAIGRVNGACRNVREKPIAKMDECKIASPEIIKSSDPKSEETCQVPSDFGSDDLMISGLAILHLFNFLSVVIKRGKKQPRISLITRSV